MTNPIIRSQKIAIFTRYYSPTNYKGARVKAFTESGRKVWTSWHADHDVDDAHNHAAQRLCEEMEWDGTLLRSNTNTGAVYLFMPRVGA